MARRWIDKLTRRRVVVHLTDGASLRGVLLDVHGDSLQLTAAEYLEAEGARPVDGHVVVPRGRVAWLQDLTPGDDGGPLP